MTLYLPHESRIYRLTGSWGEPLLPRQIRRWRREIEVWKDSGAAGIPIPRPLERILRAFKTFYTDDNELLRVGAVTWSSYINGAGGAPFPPVGWWSMRATSGTNEPNRGSGGAALDMTILSATLGQVGKLGANEAALCDGANTRYQTANNAALAALTTWEYVFLVNPSSAGESNVGRFFSWGNGFASNEPTFGINAASGVMAVTVFNTTPTSFIAVTSTTITLSSYSLLFAAYADGGDRKGHAYVGRSGAVNEAAYSAQPALTGTYKAPALPLNLFNNTAQSLTFAGLADEALIVSGNLATATTRTQLAILAGV